jgi:hypothetical protein
MIERHHPKQKETLEKMISILFGICYIIGDFKN